MSEPDASAIRAEVRTWLEAHWRPDRALVEWLDMLIDSGWGVPSWPERWYGRGFPAAIERAVFEEFDRIGAIGIARTGVRRLAAATLLEHGSDAQKRKFLRRCLTGEDGWCQLFSEPGSGSDLAGATTRAELRDGRWIVNGQKTWTTSAHHAKWGLLVARTDWDLPKHQGLSYFILDIEQPGVEVYPLRQMNGHASFNQVFLTDAEVPPEHLLGDPGDGWSVVTTTLMHERRLAGDIGQMFAMPEGEGRIFDEERARIEESMEPYRWYPQRAGRVDIVLQRARETGRIDDPVVRQEIAKLLTLSMCKEWTALRARAAQRHGGQGPDGSIGKLVASHVSRAAANVHALLAGSDTMLAGEDAPLEGLIAEIILSAPANSIAGGTDEIQRNIIAERVLGMPKEQRTDNDRPFREVPSNPVRD